MASRCTSTTWLTDEELELLTTLPDAQYNVPQQVTCELETLHDGHHTAFAQCQDEAEEAAWWLMWDDASGWRRLTELAFCPAVDGGDGACLLPAEHLARHSFLLLTQLIAHCGALPLGSDSLPLPMR